MIRTDLLSGLLAHRPAAARAPGVIYFATDDNGGTLYRSNGVAWVALAPGVTALAGADAVIFKGVIDCSANPNYPAADAGHLYRVSVAGKIGGASGTNVEVGDTLLCLTDGTASGTQAAVGANWSAIQANIDGAVVGPTSATSGDFPTFNGTTGKLIQDSGLALDTDVLLAAASDLKLPSQKAVKAYADAVKAALAAAYREVIPWRMNVLSSAQAAGTYGFSEGYYLGAVSGGANSSFGIVYLDPADHAVAGLATKYRVRAVCATRTTGPGNTITIGLYPLGPPGAAAYTETLGTVTAGSTVAFASQAGVTNGQGNSGDFTAPTAGFYGLGFVVPSTTAVSSELTLAATLQAHNV